MYILLLVLGIILAFSITFVNATGTAIYAASTAISEHEALAIKQDLKNASIIPELLPKSFMPRTYMNITYKENITVTEGTVVSPNDTDQRPQVSFAAINPDAQYTIAMVDLDVKSPLVRHWIAGNIDSKNSSADFNDNSTLHQYTSYHGPKPPLDGKVHRYVFVLYEQRTKNQSFVPVLEEPAPNRALFNLTEFAYQNDLKPIAASFMLASHED